RREGYPRFNPKTRPSTAAGKSTLNFPIRWKLGAAGNEPHTTIGIRLSCDHTPNRRGKLMAPPFINSTGLVTKILDKIIEASQPERFTQDFLDKLGYGNSGSAKPIIPLLKRL